MAKPKPDKLVNQFFAKELVNPKPKTSIKIGFITSKISKSAPEPVPLAPGLEICPVTPPDGYSMRSKETVEEPSHSQGIHINIFKVCLKDVFLETEIVKIVTFMEMKIVESVKE